MQQWLTWIAQQAVTIIHAMALFVIVVGTLQAFVRTVRGVFGLATNGHLLRDAYVQYARWLVAGLTFQLAADIIETSIAPDWDEIGRLGAIALIRTILNYFLERDLGEVSRRAAESRTVASS